MMLMMMVVATMARAAKAVVVVTAIINDLKIGCVRAGRRMGRLDAWSNWRHFDMTIQSASTTCLWSVDGLGHS